MYINNNTLKNAQICVLNEVKKCGIIKTKKITVYRRFRVGEIYAEEGNEPRGSLNVRKRFSLHFLQY